MTRNHRRREPELTEPLMSVPTVGGFLDEDEDGIVSLIAKGALPWAFDIGSSGKQRREIRVLPHSLCEFQAARGKKGKAKTGPRPRALAWKQAMRLLFGDREKIRASELARVLGCSPWHVLNLVKSGVIGLAPGSQIRRGPHGSPEILTAEAACWLRSRRVQA